ncbi:unnamed protein product [Amoebophrya sp. A25]|nr:unnamed protein product [Amoebophrya sp. A25]|eukprot:GSA25T00025759001.1
MENDPLSLVFLGASVFVLVLLAVCCTVCYCACCACGSSSPTAASTPKETSSTKKTGEGKETLTLSGHVARILSELKLLPASVEVEPRLHNATRHRGTKDLDNSFLDLREMNDGDGGKNVQGVSSQVVVSRDRAGAALREKDTTASKTSSAKPIKVEQPQAHVDFSERTSANSKGARGSPVVPLHKDRKPIPLGKDQYLVNGGIVVTL